MSSDHVGPADLRGVGNKPPTPGVDRNAHERTGMDYWEALRPWLVIVLGLLALAFWSRYGR